jgi:hypothetical protein
MEIHKPKPWHGWREFAKEVGTIVLGVLIAIGFEQAVEALHHAAQAREMVRKLREESLGNRHVIDYDLGRCHSEIAAAARDIDVLSQAIRARRLAGLVVAPLPPQGLYRPGDAAWVTIRDSALLSIMPQRTIDNYWKIDATNESMTLHSRQAGEAFRRLQALAAVSGERPMDEALANDVLLKLNEFAAEEASYCAEAEALRRLNEQGLAGQAIDPVGDLQKTQGRQVR